MEIRTFLMQIFREYMWKVSFGDNVLLKTSLGGDDFYWNSTKEGLNIMILGKYVFWRIILTMTPFLFLSQTHNFLEYNWKWGKKPANIMFNWNYYHWYFYFILFYLFGYGYDSKEDYRVSNLPTSYVYKWSHMSVTLIME